MLQVTTLSIVLFLFVDFQITLMNPFDPLALSILLDEQYMSIGYSLGNLEIK